MAPELDQLNKRRVERQIRKQKALAQQRRKKTLAMLLVIALMILGGVGLFFLLRAEEKETPPQEQATGVINEVSEDATVIHLVAAGDVNVSDNIVGSGGSDYDYTNTFLDIAHLLAEGDITVVNFEGNLIGAPYGSATHSAPQNLLNQLSNCGVDLVQLANSYAINQGISGLQATIRGVKEAGMEPLGVYADEKAYKSEKGYTIREVQGIRIAFVAFTKGMDGMSLPQGSENCVNVLYKDYDSTYQTVDQDKINKILDAVEAEKPDLTVAMLHWGSEYNDNVSKTQETIVDLLKNRGVDAILGTHPHYVQEMSYDPETGFFVAYSLGDLLSDGKRSGTEYSVILNLEIAKQNGMTKIMGYSFIPIFTVAERGKPLRSVRIAETMSAYENNYLLRVQDSTYESMTYALERIEARTKGE